MCYIEENGIINTVKEMEVEKMETKKDKELSIALSQFLKLVYVDFGISKFNDNIRHWYNLNWDEFKKELESHSVRLNDCLAQDWKDFFHKHKAKVLELQK